MGHIRELGGTRTKHDFLDLFRLPQNLGLYIVLLGYMYVNFDAKRTVKKMTISIPILTSKSWSKICRGARFLIAGFVPSYISLHSSWVQNSFQVLIFEIVQIQVIKYRWYVNGKTRFTMRIHGYLSRGGNEIIFGQTGYVLVVLVIHLRQNS